IQRKLRAAKNIAFNHFISGLPTAYIINSFDRNSSPKVENGPAELQSLLQNGFVSLGPLSADVQVYRQRAKALFDSVPQEDPKLNAIAIRHPFLLGRAAGEVLRDRRLNDLIVRYIGSDATFDRALLFRIPACSQESKLSGLWHHDRVGKRLKLFLLLDDVGPDSRPTHYAVGSHKKFLLSNSYRASRFLEEQVRPKYRVELLTGKCGEGILFDTHGLHRATWEHRETSRDALVLEWSSAAKARLLTKFGVPIGICEELFPLDFDFSGTLVDKSRLSQQGPYIRYDGESQLHGNVTIDAREHLVRGITAGEQLYEAASR
ncbi:MAG: hypothetical protein KDD53_06465, partial [Bdellovibrionales bacterium]|nr:hypothetical protein [Bdellovibrionales bacterium]